MRCLPNSSCRAARSCCISPAELGALQLSAGASRYPWAMRRSLVVVDTGDVPGFPGGVTYRFRNVTLACTAGLTHPLPPGGTPPRPGLKARLVLLALAASSSSKAALLATLCALTVSAAWWMRARRRPRQRELAQLHGALNHLKLVPCMHGAVSASACAMQGNGAGGNGPLPLLPCTLCPALQLWWLVQVSCQRLLPPGHEVWRWKHASAGVSACTALLMQPAGLPAARVPCPDRMASSLHKPIPVCMHMRKPSPAHLASLLPVPAGTFGEVWHGRMAASGREVAVKVLQFPASERRRVARVVRECRISARCRHPNIVAAHTHFTIAVRRKLVPAAERGQQRASGSRCVAGRLIDWASVCQA